jgi:hypothetical protein
MLCLKDDDGISEEAYESLIEYLLSQNEQAIVIEINSKCKTANGRRYILDDTPTDIFEDTRARLDKLTSIRNKPWTPACK